jgi:hypothetical protein
MPCQTIGQSPISRYADSPSSVPDCGDVEVGPRVVLRHSIEHYGLFLRGIPQLPDCASEGAVEHQRPGEGECAARTAALKILTMQGSALSAALLLSVIAPRAGSTISRERSFAAAVTRRSRSQPRLRSAGVRRRTLRASDDAPERRGSRDGERRHLTVLFCDLVGSTMRKIF